MRSSATILATVLLSLASVAGAAQPWVADMDHTRVTFEISHLGYSVLPGMFREFDIDFQFDPDAPADSGLEVVIDAASIDMFNADLNEHLRNEDFFHVTEHPTLTFTSTEVVPTGENSARVDGEMTLLGVTRPVSFDVTLNRIGPHPMSGNRVAGFSATGSLDRTEFGMDYAAPLVGEEVAFTLTGEFSPKSEQEQ